MCCALQEQLSSVQGASSAAQQLQQHAEDQASTIRSLQAALASLRAELEISQTSLFELTARQEQAAGSASTAEQLAVEEVERLSSELLSIRKEKALLERQLQQLQQKQADRIDASGGNGNVAAQESGLDVGSDTLADARQQQQTAAAAAAADGQLAAAEAALAAAEEAARDQQHQVALLI
jgi:PIN domain nuclease of toxin-antitoxin system